MSGYAGETFCHQKNPGREANFIRKPFSINSFPSCVSKMETPSRIGL